MGQIYRWSDIRDNRIPTPGDFLLVVEEIKNAINEHVRGAVLAGSVIHGTPTNRSDVDLVVYTDGSVDATAQLNSLRHLARDHRVMLNIVQLDDVMIGTRFHTISYGFYQHLLRAVDMGGGLGDPFLHLLPASTMSPYNEAVEYLGYKFRYLVKSLTELDYPDCDDRQQAKDLSKGLEIGIHAARPYLNVAGVEVLDDSKAGIFNIFNMVAPHLGEMLAEIMELDQAYSEELDRQLIDPDRDAYAAHWGGLASQMDIVVHYLRAMALAMESLLDEQAR